MAHSVDRRSVLVGAIAGTTTGPLGQTGGKGRRSVLIEAERATIQAGMAEGGISGAAVAMVDGDEPTWLESFGRTSVDDGAPVGIDTLFSIQSTSKSFAAVAVLLAVQEGLLDLDQPITAYLPDFTVQSRFETRPQDRITLRLLLSNRAGFTHEAPIGNNYEPEAESFEAHVRSISDTWLRFPVGERYRYSNLGYDLAGHILQTTAGVPYAEWLKRRLFQPLGMNGSTADPAVYAVATNRAVGIQAGHVRVPLVTPLVASGGVYTTARDMAAYVAFHLGRGAWRGRRVLAPELWAEMHGFGLGGDYSLGVIREERKYGTTPVRLMSHVGGGFGFGCVFRYCPDAGFGWAALFNRPARQGYRFGDSLIDGMLASRHGARALRSPPSGISTIQPLEGRMRALSGTYVGRDITAEIVRTNEGLELRRDGSPPRALEAIQPDVLFVAEDGETLQYRLHPATRLAPAHWECERGEDSLDHNDGPDTPEGPNKAEWGGFVGRYRIDQWGRRAIEVSIERRRGYLYLNGIRLIIETESGLFFTSDGEAVDFRADPPTWRSLLMRRV